MVEPDPHVVQQWQLLFIRIYTMWYNLAQLNAQDLVNFDVFSGGGAIYNAFSSTPSLLFQSHSMRFEVQNLHWMLTLGRKTNEEKAAMLRRSLSFQINQCYVPNWDQQWSIISYDIYRIMPNLD